MQYLKKLAEVVENLINLSLDDEKFATNSDTMIDDFEIISHCVRDNKIFYEIKEDSSEITRFVPEIIVGKWNDIVLQYWNSQKNNPDKVFIYCRVSSPKQDNDEKGQKSLHTQEQQCRYYANRVNIPICATIKEIKSAKLIKYQKKLIDIAECMTGNNLLLVWNVCRFSRDTVGGQNIIQKIIDKGASVYFIDDNISITPDCKPIVMHKFREYLNQARLESEIISWRIKGQKKIQAIKGSYLGSVAPYGYEIHIENDIKKLKPNNEEMQNISSIKNGMNTILGKRKYTQMANILNTDGAKRGKRWTESSVRRINKIDYKNKYEKFM